MISTLFNHDLFRHMTGQVVFFYGKEIIRYRLPLKPDRHSALPPIIIIPTGQTIVREEIKIHYGSQRMDL